MLDSIAVSVNEYYSNCIVSVLTLGTVFPGQPLGFYVVSMFAFKE